MSRRSALRLLSLALALSCTDATGPVPRELSPRTDLVDARNGGASNFYFLPPLAPSTAYTGVFDPSASPSVEVCRVSTNPSSCTPIATFTSQGNASARIRVDSIAQHYIVQWKTKADDLDLTSTYRIRVIARSAELGHADTRMLRNNGEAKNLSAGLIGVVLGSTLAIKFRIETTSLGPPVSATIGRDGGSIVAQLGGGSSMTLTIPADALLFPTAFTITPQQPGGAGKASALIEPGDILFHERVTLSVSTGSAPSASESRLLALVLGDPELPGLHILPTSANGNVFTASTGLLGSPSMFTPSTVLQSQDMRAFAAATGTGTQVTLSQVELTERIRLLHEAAARFEADSSFALAFWYHEAIVTLLPFVDDEELVRTELNAAGSAACSALARQNSAALERLSESYSRFWRAVTSILTWAGIVEVLGVHAEPCEAQEDRMTVLSNVVKKFDSLYVEFMDAEVFPDNAMGLWNELYLSIAARSQLDYLGLEAEYALLRTTVQIPLATRYRKAASETCRAINEHSYLGDLFRAGRNGVMYPLGLPQVSNLAAGVEADLNFGTTIEQLSSDLHYCGTWILFTSRKTDGAQLGMTRLGSPEALQPLITEDTVQVEPGGTLELSDKLIAFNCPDESPSDDRMLLSLNGTNVGELIRVQPTVQFLRNDPVILGVDSLARKAGIATGDGGVIPLVLTRQTSFCATSYQMEGESSTRSLATLWLRFPEVTIDVEPDTVELDPEVSATLTATVNGTSETDVTWSATGGTIQPSGNSVLYTAGTEAGTFSVTAKSVADSTKTATATIIVTPDDECEEGEECDCPEGEECEGEIGITIVPGNVTLPYLEPFTFLAFVTGTENTAVTWTASRGGIIPGGEPHQGIYLATACGEDSVYATSVADPGKRAGASVTVTGCSEPPPGPDPEADTVAGIGSAWGDPHIVSMDGLKYDFMAVGDYILSKSTAPFDKFEVQGRFKRPAGDQEFSWNEAVAVNVNGDIVNIYAKATGTPNIIINGQDNITETHGLEIQLNQGGRIDVEGSRISVSWPDGSLLQTGPAAWEPGVLAEVKLTVPAARRNFLQGLFGNFDHDRSNDLKLRDGTPVGNDVLYTTFRSSWNVPTSSSENLFTDKFENFDIEFPPRAITIDKLNPELVLLARGICANAGIVDSQILGACILDVVLTGDEEWADIAANNDPGAPGIIVIPRGWRMERSTTQAFGAAVSGDDRRVTWTATDGTINPTSDNTMIYTAPQLPGRITITARLVAHPEIFATSSVIVTCLDESIVTGGSVSGNLPNLRITGAVSLSGDASACSVTVVGTGAVLDLNGHRLATGALTTGASNISSGIVRMANPADSVLVNGPAIFWGQGSFGNLTAGEMKFRGNVAFTCPFDSGEPFRASGSHRIRFDGTEPQTLAICPAHQIQNMRVSNAAGLTVNGTGAGSGGAANAQVLGTLDIDAGARLTVGAGMRVTGVGNVTTGAGSMLDGNQLRVLTGLNVGGSYGVISTIFAGAGQTVPGISYNSMTVNGAALLGGSTTLSGNLEISGAGSALDVNGQSLAIAGGLTASGLLKMVHPSGLVTVSGDAFFSGGGTFGNLTAGEIRFRKTTVFNCPFDSGEPFRATGTHTVRFDGTVAQTLSICPGHHMQNLRVSNAAGLTINGEGTGGGGAPNGQVLGTLTIDPAARLTVGIGMRVSVTGDITTGAGSSLNGNQIRVFAALNVGGTYGVFSTVFFGADRLIAPLAYHSVVVAGTSQLTSTTSLTGNLQVDAALTVNGQILNVAGNLDTGGGPLRMVSDADRVNVNGYARFQAQGTAGNLTAGIIRVRGNFTANCPFEGGGPFLASGTHEVILDGTAAQELGTCPQHRLQTLRIQNSAGVTESGTTIANGIIDLSGRMTVPAGHGLHSLGSFFVRSTGILMNAGAVSAATCSKESGGVINNTGTITCTSGSL